ncbi:hypothetical protein HAX54_027566 [Datura stramonium]|uniref:Uncharacterized protein n=1 Tax=Datura stramonium TaxID=4076 RepID=A0ABS8S8W0_DATST|nr:hypothetical protein [Datura stramonium]
MYVCEAPMNLRCKPVAWGLKIIPTSSPTGKMPVLNRQASLSYRFMTEGRIGQFNPRIDQRFSKHNRWSDDWGIPVIANVATNDITCESFWIQDRRVTDMSRNASSISPGQKLTSRSLLGTLVEIGNSPAIRAL